MKAGFGFQDFGETPFGLCLRVEDNRTVSGCNSERIYVFLQAYDDLLGCDLCP